MTVLAATPRAMHHLHNYVAAAQNQAQVHLLNFLLSYGAPAEEAQAAPMPVASTEPVRSDAEKDVNRARPLMLSQTTVAIAQNLTGKRAIRKFAPAGFSKNAEPSLEHSRVMAQAERHYSFKLDARANARSPEINEAKIEALKSLRWLKDKKALRALQKEFGLLVRTANVRPTPRRAPVMRVSLEREAAESLLEAETGQPAPKAEDCSSKLSAGEF